MNINISIKAYIKDGEYVRGNPTYPEVIKAWLESKGGKVDKQMSCTDIYSFYYVDAITKEACRIRQDSRNIDSLLLHLLLNLGEEIIPKKLIPHFDPHNLQPFEKVLVRNTRHGTWIAGFFSHINKDAYDHRYGTTNLFWNFCIPYNNETKHLVGTKDPAPEYYNYSI